MKTAYAVALALLLVLSSACAPKVNDPGDVQAIKKSFDDYTKAVNAADADGVAALWTEKAIFAENHMPVSVGKEAIRSLQAGSSSQFKLDFAGAVEDVRVIGDLAVARGTWNMKLTPKLPGVAAINDSGSWVASAARQIDGSWKWDWCAPNSNLPLPGSTATGEEEQALYQLERDWAAAGPKKDIAVVDRFLAKEFISNADGRIRNKQQLLAEMKNNTAQIESAANSDMMAMVFGDTAIVHGLYDEKSTTNGKDTSQKGRYTEVYVKRDGRWQCVTQYATRVQ